LINLMNEPEIFSQDKAKGQILNESDYVQNLHYAIGFASRCWTEEGGKGTFDTEAALRIVNELCAYVRLIKEGKAT